MTQVQHKKPVSVNKNKSVKTQTAMNVIERAISTGHFLDLLTRLNHKVIRQAQSQRLGLIHAAMRLSDVVERNQSMSLLVNMGADVNAVNASRQTALHEAVDRCDLEAMDILMGLGADVNAQDGQGKTPLHWSAKKSRIRPATRLISAGASASIRDDEGKIFTDLGSPSFVRHIELLLDVRKTIRVLDVALKKHAGIPIPLVDDPRICSNEDHPLIAGD